MDLHHIRYFLAASEAGNFTRAAEACNVSQPALTRAIKQLETEFGGPLFHRDARQVRLTHLGRLVRDHLQAIDDHAHAARLAAQQLLKMDKAPLHLGVMCTIGPDRIVGPLTAFHQEHPGIELTVRDATPETITGLIEDGSLEVALIGLPGGLPGRFEAWPLFEERMVVAFPEGHRFESFSRVPLVELAGERYLDRLNCEFRSTFIETLKARGIEIDIWHRSEREDWIQGMIRAGLGIAVVPETCVAANGISYRPLADSSLRRRVDLVTLRGRCLSPAARAFIQEMQRTDWTTPDTTALEG